MPPEIRRITETFLHNPERVEVSKPASTAVTVTQSVVSCGREPHEKRDVLRHLIRTAKDLQNAIIFCNRKREVALLHRSLQKHGFSAVALHGDMEQSARTAALDSFRKGEMPLLVASDVAARGLDIPEVSHVFNFDVPHHADDYVHRIGRTGRAGRSGTAISIATPADSKSITAIEKLIGQNIARADVGHVPSSENLDSHASDDHAPRSRSSEGNRSSEDRHHGDRKPRREREGKRPRSGGRGGEAAATGRGEAVAAPRDGADTGRPRHEGPRRDRKPAPVAATAAAPPPSIGRAPAPSSPREQASEPADHSHLPAFLLRPVRARV